MSIYFKHDICKNNITVNVFLFILTLTDFSSNNIAGPMLKNKTRYERTTGKSKLNYKRQSTKCGWEFRFQTFQTAAANLPYYLFQYAGSRTTERNPPCRAYLSARANCFSSVSASSGAQSIGTRRSRGWSWPIVTHLANLGWSAPCKTTRTSLGSSTVPWGRKWTPHTNARSGDRYIKENNRSTWTNICSNKIFRD